MLSTFTTVTIIVFLLIFLFTAGALLWLRFNTNIIDNFVVAKNNFTKTIKLDRNYSKIIVFIEHADGNHDTFGCKVTLSSNGTKETLEYKPEEDGFPSNYDLITENKDFTKKGSFDFELIKKEDYHLRVSIVGRKY